MAQFELDLNANVRLLLDSLKQAQDAIAQLRAAGEGTKTDLSKQFNNVSTSLGKLTGKLKSSETALQQFKGQATQIGQIGSLQHLEVKAEALRKKLKTLSPATREFIVTSRQLRGVETQLSAVGRQAGVTQATFSRLGSGLKSFVGGFAALFGVGATSAILAATARKSAELDDALANVRKTTGLTVDALGRLDGELRNINTRTPQQELLRLASVAGKLGVTGEKDILGFVRAADQINVALGEDLGEDGIRQIGKINDVFGQTKAIGLEKAMLATGSAINALGQSGTAAEGAIVDFTRRLAGIAVQSGIALPKIIGLGTTLDELGQTTELSATALSQLFIAMQKDTATFAKIAGQDVESFNKLLREDANEAFIVFLEGLNKNSDGLQGLAKNFDQLGIDGARAIQVVAALSQNTDKLREKQALSNKEFLRATSITNEFNVKNQNFAANLEKIGNAITNFVTNSVLSQGIQAVVGRIAELFSTVSKADKAFSAFDQARSRVEQFDQSIPPLLTRIESLKSKSDELGGVTSLTAREQEDLKDAIQQVGAAIPTAVTQFDEFGNALDINADKVRAFRSALQNMLEVKNAEALAQRRGELKLVQTDIDDLSKRLNNFDEQGRVVATTYQRIDLGDGKFQDLKKTVVLTDEQLTKMSVTLAGLQDKKQGITDVIRELLGLETSAQKAQRELSELDKLKKLLAIPVELRTADQQKEIDNLIRSLHLSEAEIRKIMDEIATALAGKGVPEAFSKELMAAILKASNELVAARKELFSKAQADELKSLSGEARIQKEREIGDKEIEELQRTLQTKKRLNFEADKDISQKRLTTLLAIPEARRTDAQKKEIEDLVNGVRLAEDELAAIHALSLANERAFNEKMGELQKERFETAISLIKDERDKEIAEFELKFKDREKKIREALTAIGASELEIETAINAERSEKINAIRQKFRDEDLQQEYEYQKAVIEAKKVGFNEELKTEEDRQIALLKTREQTLRDEALNLDITTPEGAKRNEEIKKELNDITKSIEKFKFDIASKKIQWSDIFGIEGSDEFKAKFNQTLNDTLASLQNLTNTLLSSAIQNTQQAVSFHEQQLSLIDEQISAKEQQIVDEDNLNKQGLANNLDVRKKELAALKVQKEQERKELKKAHEEQARLMRLQVVLDGIATAASLALAAANIFKSLSGLGPFGVAAAVGVVAGMLTAFYKFQADIRAASKPPDTLGAGGEIDIAPRERVVRGRSHLHPKKGHRIEDTNIFVEGGEMVNSKAATQRYWPLLEAANKNDFGKLLREDIESLPNLKVDFGAVKDSRLVVRKAEVEKVHDAKKRLERNTIVNAYNMSNAGVEKKLDTLNTEFERFRDKYFNQARVTHLNDGTKVYTRGANVTVIKPPKQG